MIVRRRPCWRVQRGYRLASVGEFDQGPACALEGLLVPLSGVLDEVAGVVSKHLSGLFPCRHRAIRCHSGIPVW